MILRASILFLMFFGTIQSSTAQVEERIVLFGNERAGEAAKAGQDNGWAAGFEFLIQGVNSKGEAGSLAGDAWSNPGFELGVAYRFGQGLALELRGSYRKWDKRRFFIYIPLYLGLRYDLRPHPRLIFSPYIGFGPSAGIINDAGGFFAAFETGLRLSTSLSSQVSITLGASYGEAMVFHLSQFSHINVLGGIRLAI